MGLCILSYSFGHIPYLHLAGSLCILLSFLHFFLPYLHNIHYTKNVNFHLFHLTQLLYCFYYFFFPYMIFSSVFWDTSNMLSAITTHICYTLIIHFDIFYAMIWHKKLISSCHKHFYQSIFVSLGCGLLSIWTSANYSKRLLFCIIILVNN